MSRLSRSLRYRWKRYRLGVWSPWKSLPVGSVTVNGQYRRLRFPPGEEEIQLHELSLILVDDCYRLMEIDSPVNVIVDIGGNIGLFTLAALNRFQPKHIHTYEPNPQIQSVLEHNTQDGCVTVYSEAFGAVAGTLELALHHNSLHTTSIVSFGPTNISMLMTLKLWENFSSKRASLTLRNLDTKKVGFRSYCSILTSAKTSH
ncbi:hypothetical protein OAK47_01795 [Planctomycetaceae bacterium]|jgi:hypothetical protein|nr:hypothetical protein [Planctomycetaceae bacterium]MDC0273452.1 hypothetical protein [Planctomycetaceae bacterium]MDG2390693.1 hypothetical protein [Planctomycetaceae bacterium]